MGALRQTAGALALFALLSAVPARGATEAATLARPYDPVILSTGRLDMLPDRRVAALRLVRVEAAQLRSIPFQIDRRDRGGALVIDAAVVDSFDDNDELVFMAADAGDRAEETVWPTDCDAVVELTVRAARDDQAAWAYLLHCPHAPPPDAVAPYVVYDRLTNHARSPNYEVAYAAARNYFTAMRLVGADGAPRPNLLRQTRMRGSPTFGLLFTDVTLEFTEQNAIVAVDGVRNGPVRAIRRAKLSVDLGSLFPNLPRGTAETFHYRNSFLTPTRFGIPALALRLLRDFHFESVIDFDPRVMPLTYWDATHSGVPLTANAPWEEGVEDHDWWVHSGAEGAVLHALLIPQQWRDWGITRGALLRTGCAEASGAPLNGHCAAGFTLRNMTGLRAAGDYDLLQATVVLPRPYRRGDETAALAMLNAPLEVETVRIR